MGMVVRVKCTKAGHPQPDKEYALKVVFNFGATTYSAVRNLYTAEFEAVSSIPRHRNITPYWAQFRDTIPPAVRCRGACTHRQRAGGVGSRCRDVVHGDVAVRMCRSWTFFPAR